MLDASVAVAWHFRDEQFSQLARQILRSVIAGDIRLIAPQHLWYEVPNAITVAAQRRSRMSEAEARLALAEFLALDIPAIADESLVLAAQDVAFQRGCAFYDALYVALAERLNLPLLTADRRLFELLAPHPLVLWIADYREP